MELRKTCPACGARYEAEKNLCPDCGASYVAARIERNNPDADELALARHGVRKGVYGGGVMIAIAAIWFYLGRITGGVDIYPLLLGAIGIYAVIHGLLTGNYAGEKARCRRGR